MNDRAVILKDLGFADNPLSEKKYKIRMANLRSLAR